MCSGTMKFIGAIRLPTELSVVEGDRKVWDSLEDQERDEASKAWFDDLKARVFDPMASNWSGLDVEAGDDSLSGQPAYVVALERLRMHALPGLQVLATKQGGVVSSTWKDGVGEDGCTDCSPPRDCHYCNHLVSEAWGGTLHPVLLAASVGGSTVHACAAVSYKVAPAK